MGAKQRPIRLSKANGFRTAAAMRAAARLGKAAVDVTGQDQSVPEDSLDETTTFVASILWPRRRVSATAAWAVLDAAADERVYNLVHLAKGDCLYRGRLPWPIQLTAPYLVRLQRSSSFSLHLLQEAWANQWGVFMRASTDARLLLEHLAACASPEVEGGNQVLFRYFDPRILQAFLPTCLPAELKDFFGPVHSFLVPGSEAGEVIEYRIVDGKLSREVTAPPRNRSARFDGRLVRAPYVPTNPEMVLEMLKLAEIRPDDILMDLGSGDGRIVIAAARRYGIRAIGVEIDEERVALARENAHQAGVSHLVSFLQGSLYDAQLKDASVVTIYLLPGVNEELRPRFLRDLRPGSRIVSHRFPIGDWAPCRVFSDEDGAAAYCWVIPEP